MPSGNVVASIEGLSLIEDKQSSSYNETIITIQHHVSINRTTAITITTTTTGLHCEG